MKGDTRFSSKGVNLTNYLIEVQSGPPLTLALSPPGGGAGNRPTLSFDTRTLLEAYLRDELEVSEGAIGVALEKGVVVAPLSSSAVDKFWKDVEAPTRR